MTKTLAELVAPLGLDAGIYAGAPITGVTADSRAVEPGACFVAISGTVAEGHDYIPDAIARGAQAVLYQLDSARAGIPDTVAAVQVPDSRRAAAVVADAFWDHPSGALTLVAVTGTNGKTTSVHLLEAIFAAAGHSTGMIGTLGRRVGDETVAASRTTPDAIELQALLARMRDSGITHVSMELSSHAIDLDRAWRCSFAGALFTNLTPDHLDWHHDLDTYRASKTRLFTDYVDLVGSGRELVGAINVDDEAGRLIAAQARCRVVTYGLQEAAQVTAQILRSDGLGSHLLLQTPDWSADLSLHLVGHFNIMNTLGAAACAWGLGTPQAAIIAGLQNVTGVPGRLEPVKRGQDFAVLVDYAHTADALENVLAAARALNPPRLICVMGCGGDRDRTKRPVMGRVADSLADLTVITSDNPRSEDPLAIIEEIKAGVVGEVVIEPDREQAIYRAVAEARSGDIVLICGKGHEDYMEFAGGRRVPFDDREVAAAALTAAGWGK